MTELIDYSIIGGRRGGAWLGRRGDNPDEGTMMHMIMVLPRQPLFLENSDNLLIIFLRREPFANCFTRTLSWIDFRYDRYKLKILGRE